MMWKKEFVAKSESPVTATRDPAPAAGGAPSAAGPARRRATTINVFGPGRSRPWTKPTRSWLAWPQLFLEELASGTTEVPGTRWEVGESERAPGKNVSGRSRVIWWRL